MMVLGADTVNTSNTLTVRCIVSAKQAGALIGKQGCNVADIREKTTVRAAISKPIPDINERILSVTGTPVSIGQAYSLFSSHLSHPCMIRMLLPHQLVGSIIGKQGIRIKEIQQNTHSKIVISKEMLPQSTERVIDIAGLPDCIGSAIHRIAEYVLEDIERYRGAILYDPIVKLGGGIASVTSSRYNKKNPNSENHIENFPSNSEETPIENQTVPIPSDMVGCIIGRAGSVINMIRQTSKAKISIAKEIDEETKDRVFTLIGTKGSIQIALGLLYKQIEIEKKKRSSTIEA